MTDGERFITPCSLPDDRQREILVILMEECAEIQHRAAKALRFGLGEIQSGQPFTNSTRLSGEVGDLQAVLNLAVQERMLSSREMGRQRILKERKLRKYMQTTGARP